MDTPQDLELFERAFTSHCSGCRRVCRCGREFFDFENSYDWEEGELEGLQKNPKTTGLPYAVGTVMLENREFVQDCDCWHERARQIKAFIDGHATQIARYLSLEKVRKQAIADAAPVVEEPDPHL